MGGKGSGGKRFWTDALVEEQLRTMHAAIGHFPSASEIRSMGKNDLVCTIGKRGGLLAWADRLGLVREHSDSDTGWSGEIAVMEMFSQHGIACERSRAIKAPFDLMADSVLRIDVKSASHATYQTIKQKQHGWFYRLGKICQADLVVLYQIDRQSIFALPWWICPTGNITIASGVSKYAYFQDNWDVINQMLRLRKNERESIMAQPLIGAA